MTFNDFEAARSVDSDFLNEYKAFVDDDLLEIWQNFGLGTFRGGYFKFIDPKVYHGCLHALLEDWPSWALPVMATGMGDLIFYFNEDYYLLNLRKGNVTRVPIDFKNFHKLIKQDYVMSRYFSWHPYQEAKRLHGDLAYEDAFVYFPPREDEEDQVEDMIQANLEDYYQLYLYIRGKE